MLRSSPTLVCLSPVVHLVFALGILLADKKLLVCLAYEQELDADLEVKVNSWDG